VLKADAVSLDGAVTDPAAAAAAAAEAAARALREGLVDQKQSAADFNAEEVPLSTSVLQGTDYTEARSVKVRPAPGRSPPTVCCQGRMKRDGWSTPASGTLLCLLHRCPPRCQAWARAFPSAMREPLAAGRAAGHRGRVLGGPRARAQAAPHHRGRLPGAAREQLHADGGARRAPTERAHGHGCLLRCSRRLRASAWC